MKDYLLLLVLIVALVGMSGVVSATAPIITEHWNSQTRDESTSFTMELKHLVVFKVTADQAITTWHWYIDGVETTEHISTTTDNFTRYFTWRAGPLDKDYTISVNGTNANGTTNTITWNVHIPLLGYGMVALQWRCK